MITGVSWVLAVRLWRQLKGSARVIPGRKWALALLFLGMASLFGGLHHGLDTSVRPVGLGGGDLFWQLTMLSIGLVSYLIVTGTGQAVLPEKWWPLLLIVSTVKLIAYVMLALPEGAFYLAILDYASAMVLVVLFSGIGFWQSRLRAAPWMVMGVTISFVAAGIQQSGWGLHQHFNHNDVYHTIQIFGVFCFYRGAQRFY